jgi:hypothetical protein
MNTLPKAITTVLLLFGKYMSTIQAITFSHIHQELLLFNHYSQERKEGTIYILCYILLFLWRGTTPRHNHPCRENPEPMQSAPSKWIRSNFDFAKGHGPKELFAPKEIRTLNLIGMPPRPRPLPLNPTPWN